MMKILNHEKLYHLLHNTLIEGGMGSLSAKSMTESLIQTSLRGVDSHGINLFPHYYQELKLGRVNPHPKICMTNTSETTCVVDADNGFGHYIGDVSIDRVIELCKKSGVACVSVKNSNHFGAAAYFTNRIANAGMFGFAFTNSEAFVNAHNSKELLLGTNPFCFSAPMREEEPFCLDMATTTVSWNKVKNHRRWNEKLGEGWAIDNDGNPTNNPHDAKSLTPIGTYKGFGLGMVIEILCAGLTLGPISKDIRPLYDLSVEGDRKISHFFMAIDISKFSSVNAVSNYIKELAERTRSFQSTSTLENVMVAGDKEKRQKEYRTTNGIPIDDDKFNEFMQISSKFVEAIK